MKSYFTKKNIGWSFGEKLWVIFFDGGAFILFARILGPEVTGQYALLMVIIGFANLLVEAGCVDAIIREKENLSFESSIFWLNVGTSLIYVAFAYTISPLLSTAFNFPEYGDYIALLLPVVFLSSLIVVPVARLKRNGKFHNLSKRNMSAGFLGKSVGLVLAVQGHGILSLIAMTVVTKVGEVLFILSVSKWRPKLRVDIGKLRGESGFIAYMSASKFVNFISKKIGVIALGHFFGQASAGLYALATRLLTYALKSINGVLLPIFYSEITKEQYNKKDLTSKHNVITKAMSILYYPVVIFVALNSEDILVNVLGSEWGAASGVLVILFITLRILGQSGVASHTLKALGDARWVFRAVAISAIVMVLGSYVGALLGRIEYVAVAYACSILVLMFGLYYPLLEKINISIKAFILDELRVLSVGIISLLVFTFLGPMVSVDGGVPSVATGFVVFMSIYSVCVFMLYRKGATLLLSLVNPPTTL